MREVEHFHGSSYAVKGNAPFDCKDKIVARTVNGPTQALSTSLFVGG